MRIEGRPYRTIWLDDDRWSIRIIDQARLPHAFEVQRLTTFEEVARAIREMHVRGAPLIGVAAAYGVALAMRQDPSDAMLERACTELHETRPTAVNLLWALNEMRLLLRTTPPFERVRAAYARAGELAEEDVATCRSIGTHGLPLLERIAKQKEGGGPVNVLTHCNAGWLATVDWGTALSPVFHAHEAGVPVHVFVDETRPRSQGLLTAWELRNHGVPHTVIVDNAGGHLMQHGRVDSVITGTDRTTRNGDVCNKIGTYLKALAAHDNGVPFYAAVPGSSIDWTLTDGVKQIPIEERHGLEVREMTGLSGGKPTTVQVLPAESAVSNPGFDVTPARLVTGLITERGVCAANETELVGLYPERRTR